MNTRKKWLLAGVIAAAIMLLGLLLSYFVFQIPLFDASGWRTTAEGKQQYLNYFGFPSKGWVSLEDNRYYFDDSGYMHTGWLTTEDGTYYLGQDGIMLTDLHRLEADGQTGVYYFEQDGKARRGWLHYYGAGSYYFGEDFRGCIGWNQIEGQHYFFDDDATMHTGWLEQGDNRYYLDPWRLEGWVDLDDGRYYFAEDGKALQGWLTLQEGTYYLESSGKMYTGWLTLPTDRYYLQPDGLMATGVVTIDGAQRYFQETGAYIPLVNPWNPLTDDFVLQLVEVEKYKVDATCAQALQDMLTACRNAGNKVQINSAYRDEAKQKSIWEEYRKNYMAQGYSYDQAEKLTAGYVAVPGTSEHHTGLGIDLGSGSKTYQWLAEHCWEYGFILRYPEDKTNETGFNYEPWHFRYLGKPLAEAVYDSGLTLEAYLATMQ